MPCRKAHWNFTRRHEGTKSYASLRFSWQRELKILRREAPLLATFPENLDVRKIVCRTVKNIYALRKELRWAYYRLYIRTLMNAGGNGGDL